METKIFDAILTFIKKYPRYQTEDCLAQNIGCYWHKYIFENGSDRIVLTGNITCPMKPGWIGMEPDYLNKKEDYSISIIHENETVFQDSISECMYGYFITIAKDLNKKQRDIPTLTDFIDKYSKKGNFPLAVF